MNKKLINFQIIDLQDPIRTAFWSAKRSKVNKESKILNYISLRNKEQLLYLKINKVSK